MNRLFTFVVTEDCQLRCKYCYLIGKNRNGRMSADIAHKAVDYILSEEHFNDASNIIVDFIGGEPLMEIDLLEDVISYFNLVLKKKRHPWQDHLKIRITSNGLLYHQEKVQQFISRHKENLEISISIDGIPQKHDMNRIFSNGNGSYDAVVENVKLWISQFPNAGTKMTISHNDLLFVKDSLVHLIGLGLTIIDVNPVLEAVWQKGDDVVLEEQLVEIADYIIENGYSDKVYLSCFDEDLGSPVRRECLLSPCGSNPIAIDAQGKIYSCIRYKQYSLREKKERVIGDIDKGINWNLLRPYQTFDSVSAFPIECQSCEVGSLCKWCPAESYDSSDTDTIYQRSTASCAIYKAIVRANNYYKRRLEVGVYDS